MNFRFIKNVGAVGLTIGMLIAVPGIITGTLPVIMAGAIILAITFATMQVGWCLPKESDRTL